MESILMIKYILNNQCSGFCGVCSDFAEYILRDFEYTSLMHIILKTPIPVKFLLAALAPFYGDEGGRRNRRLF